MKMRHTYLGRVSGESKVGAKGRRERRECERKVRTKSKSETKGKQNEGEETKGTQRQRINEGARTGCSQHANVYANPRNSVQKQRRNDGDRKIEATTQREARVVPHPLDHNRLRGDAGKPQRRLAICLQGSTHSARRRPCPLAKLSASRRRCGEGVTSPDNGAVWGTKNGESNETTKENGQRKEAK